MNKKQNAIHIQEKLERRILHGLSCEWDAALWVLSPEHQRRIKKPLIRLQDMKSRWGYWSKERREISISRKLVLNHTWDSVREVLLHEIAHQFTDTVLFAQNEPPHGPTFLRACQLLRANPKASGRYRPLREQIFHPTIRPKDRTLLRVKKLMALAESQNRHEAEAAMAKAHELIAKYNVDLITHEEKRDFVSIFLGAPALRHRREEYHLARLLEDFYFVSGLWVSAYVLEKNKMGRVLEISGTVQNINIAGYIYDFVQRYIDTQWREYNRGKGLNRHRLTDFAVGVIEGFRDKLETEVEAKEKMIDGSALVRAEDHLLKKYVAYKYPHTRSFSRSASSQDDRILNDGMRLGKKLVISKGITSKKKSGKLLT
ncbi:SprT-like domain-containing protein [Thermodesulfobacteriota bacterium]